MRGPEAKGTIATAVLIDGQCSEQIWTGACHRKFHVGGRPNHKCDSSFLSIHVNNQAVAFQLQGRGFRHISDFQRPSDGLNPAKIAVNPRIGSYFAEFTSTECSATHDTNDVLLAFDRHKDRCAGIAWISIVLDGAKLLPAEGIGFHLNDRRCRTLSFGSKQCTVVLAKADQIQNVTQLRSKPRQQTWRDATDRLPEFQDRDIVGGVKPNNVRLEVGMYEPLFDVLRLATNGERNLPGRQVVHRMRGHKNVLRCDQRAGGMTASQIADNSDRWVGHRRVRPQSFRHRWCGIPRIILI